MKDYSANFYKIVLPKVKKELGLKNIIKLLVVSAMKIREQIGHMENLPS